METQRHIWSVGRKLAAGFTAVIILAIIVGATGLIAMNTVKTDVDNSTIQARIATLSNLIGLNMLEARGAEKNFYIRYGELGITEAKNVYLPEIDSQLNDILAYAQEGASLAQTEENVARFQEIQRLTNEYETQFREVVATVEQRGYRNTGIEGEFLTKATEFEEAVYDTEIDSLIIRLLVIRGNGKDYVLYRDPIYGQEIEDNIALFIEQVNELPSSQLNATEKSQIIDLANQYRILANDLAEIDFALNQDMLQNGEVVEAIDQEITDIRATAQELRDTAIEGANQTINAASTVETIVLILAILGGFSIAIFLSRHISRPIGFLTEAVTSLANGDLKQRAQITSQDELGTLAIAFNQMADNLQRLIESERQAKDYLETTVNDYVNFVDRVSDGDLTARLAVNGSNDALSTLGHNLNQMVERLSDITHQIREATANITSAAAEILAATTQQASGANEQSAAINQTTTTISEVKAIVEQAFQKAETVAQRATRSNEISYSGQQAVDDTVSGMSQIKEKVAGIAENILALSEQTQQIGEITATVNEIASQSNLLALNASVEAARAGEHGKGFAVVAVEVRNLAEQSKQATAQVKTILNEIQQATNAAVMATEEGTKGVDSGVVLTEQTGDTIRQLTQSIAESADAAQQIVASAKQQTTGMEQISLAMQNINQATMQNLASTRQTERSAQDLSSVAKQLDSLVARYKLN